MIYDTLKQARQDPVPHGVDMHYVKLRSGKWSRCMGPPGPDPLGVLNWQYRHIRGNVWHMV